MRSSRGVVGDRDVWDERPCQLTVQRRFEDRVAQRLERRHIAVGATDGEIERRAVRANDVTGPRVSSNGSVRVAARRKQRQRLGDAAHADVHGRHQRHVRRNPTERRIATSPSEAVDLERRGARHEHHDTQADPSHTAESTRARTVGP